MKLNLQHARPSGQAQLAKATHATRRASVLPPQAAAQTENKTSVRQPRPENISGDFYVDHTCIGALLGAIACLYDNCIPRTLVPFRFMSRHSRCLACKQPCFYLRVTP